MKYKMSAGLVVSLVILVIAVILPGHGNASSTVAVLKGQSVYVPIYSHIYHGDNEREFDLAATLSIRNIDPQNDITLVAVDYFDSDGNLLKKYVKKPIQLKKLATTRYIIKGSDKSGGSGAKFIVRWTSVEAVNAPLIESIMIATASQQGISFISRGQPIQE